ASSILVVSSNRPATSRILTFSSLDLLLSCNGLSATAEPDTKTAPTRHNAKATASVFWKLSLGSTRIFCAYWFAFSIHLAILSDTCVPAVLGFAESGMTSNPFGDIRFNYGVVDQRREDVGEQDGQHDAFR